MACAWHMTPPWYLLSFSCEVMLMNIKKALDLTSLHRRSGYLWSGVVFPRCKRISDHIGSPFEEDKPSRWLHGRSGHMFPCFLNTLLEIVLGLVTRRRGAAAAAKRRLWRPGRRKAAVSTHPWQLQRLTGWRLPPRIRTTQQHLWQPRQVPQEKREWNRKSGYLRRTLGEELSYTGDK